MPTLQPPHPDRAGGQDGSGIGGGGNPYGSEDELLKATIGASRVEAERVLLRNGGNRKGDDYQPYNVRLKYGNRSDYIRARLRRDHPELAQKVDAGEMIILPRSVN